MNEDQIQTTIEILAHKVKNPTHAIGLNLEVLKSKIEKLSLPGAEDLKDNVEIISNELGRLNHIIERFVEYLAPAGKERKPIKLLNLFKIIRAAVEPIARGNQIQLEFQVHLKEYQIQVNEDEIRRAFIDIIMNAIEASDPGKKVIIRLEESAGEVQIVIEDDGSGVTKENGPRIFDVGYTTRKRHLGMGLPLARKLIEENGGKIRMRTAALKGTLVLVSFQI